MVWTRSIIALVALAFSAFAVTYWTMSGNMTGPWVRVAEQPKAGPKATPMPTKDSLQRALAQADAMKAACGELCDTDRSLKPGRYFGTATASVSCPALMANEQIDAQRDGLWCVLPKGRLYDYFTMNGKMRVAYPGCMDAPYLGHLARTPVWTKEHVDDWVGQAKNRTLKGTYGVSESNCLIDGVARAKNIAGGRVMIIGSERPWVEAIVLAAGAREVVTLEYGKIESQHPQVNTLTPSEMRAQYADGSLGLFDAIVSFSSLEHSGLGRYGDAINPWGDILSVARAWCVTKTGGDFVMGVMYGDDVIKFNRHRIYKTRRYPYLMANWKQVWRHPGGGQKVHVFEKMPAPA